MCPRTILCVALIPTSAQQGFGQLATVTSVTRRTRSSRRPRPEIYLAADLVTALNATLRYCPVLAAEPQGRLAAIVDFTFNLGAGRLQTSTLRRRVNQRDWSAAASELRRWVYGGGKVLPGLAARREAEVALLRLN